MINNGLVTMQSYETPNNASPWLKLERCRIVTIFTDKDYTSISMRAIDEYGINNAISTLSYTAMRLMTGEDSILDKDTKLSDIEIVTVPNRGGRQIDIYVSGNKIASSSIYEVKFISTLPYSNEMINYRGYTISVSPPTIKNGNEVIYTVFVHDDRNMNNNPYKYHVKDIHSEWYNAALDYVDKTVFEDQIKNTIN